MGKLAIRGHATRGKEVIELLEMLGGINFYGKNTNDESFVFYVSDDKRIRSLEYKYSLKTEAIVFTIEEFLEKFQYKVGDKIYLYKTGNRFIYDDVYKIYEMFWKGDTIVYRIKDKYDCVGTSYWVSDEFLPYKETMKEITDTSMAPKFKVGDKVKSKHNKYTYEITQVSDTHYTIIDIEYKCKYTEPISEDENWELLQEDMKLIQEETMEENNKINTICFNDVVYEDKTELVLGDNYEIKVEDGKTYVVLKKPQYPKTYEECFNICFGNKHDIVQVVGLDDLGDNKELFENFIKLKICRDAYWKIAGEQMGFGKPWEPDWTKADEIKYCIVNTEGNITEWVQKTTNKILAFPTKEMRDAFFENFKDLIEQCKELL